MLPVRKGQAAAGSILTRPAATIHRAAGYYQHFNAGPMSVSTRNIIAWILQALLAFAFTASGIMKFLHLSDTVATFGKLGLPPWFAYFIAAAEVLGGIALLVPRLVRPAAIGLALIMVGAAFMHTTRIPGGLLPNGMPALLLLLLLVVLARLRQTTPLAN